MSTHFFRTCLGVFQGGGCRAAAHAGAAKMAMEQGVQFAEVAGTSAGSIIAALIGAGASGDTLEEIVRTLNYSQFKSPAHQEKRRSLVQQLITSQEPIRTLSSLIYDQGLYSPKAIESWMEAELQKLLPDAPKPVPFSSLIIPTYLVASDLLHQKSKVWTQVTDPTESVSKAVMASCAIPLFFQPVEHRFVDGGLLSNLPSFVFQGCESSDRPTASRILSFLLEGEPETSQTEWTTGRLLALLVETTVSGATDLQVSLQRGVSKIVIPTGKIRATEFDKLDASGVNKLLSAGRQASKKFFEEELSKVRSEPNPEGVCYGTDERYNAITDALSDKVDEIIIAETGTDWVFSLFPSLLFWSLKGCKIRVVLQTTNKSGNAVYQRRLLTALGAHVCEVESIPFSAWLINPRDDYRPRAIVSIPASGTHSKIEAIRYEGILDRVAIMALEAQIKCLLTNESRQSCTVTMEGTNTTELFKRLKTLPQYQKPEVKLSLETVEVSRLVSLTNYVREYKSRQIAKLVELYADNGLDLFEPAVVKLTNGKESIITPPVLEESGSGLLIIEGSTRAVYCRDHGINRFRAVVVRNVVEPIPASTVEFRRVRIVSKTLGPQERYPNFVYGRFRHIERSVHPYESLDE